MLKNLIKTPTADLCHEDWLNLRKRSIGGSDAAAIIGLNPWATAYTVWADKTDRLPAKEDNEAMRQGRDLEAYVADRFVEATGKKVKRVNYILSNPKYPFAHANIDRMVVGEDSGLECKTTSVLNLKKFANGDYPDSYYVQCMHYMAVTGAKKWYLAVLVLNQGFYIFEIERNEDEINALMEQEVLFWEHVKNDTQPPADGFEPTTEALKTIYADSHSDSISLFGRDTLIEKYFSLKNEQKELEKSMEEIKQTLMQDLGEADTGVTDSYKVTWKGQSRKTFDVKAFAEDYPDIELDGYYKVSSFRKFDIKEIKK